MVLGQSAATAACQAIDQQKTVQDIDYSRLRTKLLNDKQVLDVEVKKLFEFDYPPLKGGGFKPNSWLRHHNFFYCTGKA